MEIKVDLCCGSVGPVLFRADPVTWTGSISTALLCGDPLWRTVSFPEASVPQLREGEF